MRHSLTTNDRRRRCRARCRSRFCARAGHRGDAGAAPRPPAAAAAEPVHHLLGPPARRIKGARLGRRRRPDRRMPQRGLLVGRGHAPGVVSRSRALLHGLAGAWPELRHLCGVRDGGLQDLVGDGLFRKHQRHLPAVGSLSGQHGLLRRQPDPAQHVEYGSQNRAAARLDAILPNLEELDFSRTNVSGYLPPMPRNLKVCRMPPTMCYHPTAPWANLVPGMCTEGLPVCAGEMLPPPPHSATFVATPVRPHWGDVPDPLEEHGLLPVSRELELLADWLVARGHAFLVPDRSVITGIKVPPKGMSKTELVFKDGLHWPCTVRIETFRGHISGLRVNVDWWGSKLLPAFVPMDISLPANTLSELKLMGQLELVNISLTGDFPAWILGFRDLAFLSLRGNNLTGLVLALGQLEGLEELDLNDNRLGPFEPLNLKEGPYCYAVRQAGGKACWTRDAMFSSPRCREQMVWCGDGTPEDVRPMGDWRCAKAGCWFVAARAVWSSRSGRTLQCREASPGNCTFYADSACTEPASADSVLMTSFKPPVVCSQPQLTSTAGGCVCPCLDGWCASAWKEFGAANATFPAPIPVCLRSCDDAGHFVPVLRSGAAGVRCVGPDAQRCSWFLDADCAKLAPGEPARAGSFAAEGDGMRERRRGLVQGGATRPVRRGDADVHRRGDDADRYAERILCCREMEQAGMGSWRGAGDGCGAVARARDASAEV